MDSDQATARAAFLLIGRLVRNHGLTLQEAVTAVDQRHRRETGPHTDLVAREATAFMTEVLAPFRTLFDAFQEMAKAATAAMNTLGRTLQRPAQQSSAAAYRDRPAWATPYGPPPGHRR